MFKARPRFSTVLLLTIATFDLLTTMFWLSKGQAEGNELFAALARQGFIYLVVGKLIFLIVPILMLEYARSKRPLTGEIGTWIAVLGYAYLYVGHIIELRHQLPLRVGH